MLLHPAAATDEGAAEGEAPMAPDDDAAAAAETDPGDDGADTYR